MPSLCYTTIAESKNRYCETTYYQNCMYILHSFFVLVDSSRILFRKAMCTANCLFFSLLCNYKITYDIVLANENKSKSLLGVLDKALASLLKENR